MCFSIGTEKDLKKLSQLMNAKVAGQEFFKLQSLVKDHPELGLKIPLDDGVVYPNYFAPVIKCDHGERVIYPMRYRVRPNGSEQEFASHINVFNARSDSLKTRTTWQKLFGKKHGVVPLKRFYEWVEVETPQGKKKKKISFSPQDIDLMWSPCLYDYWVSPDRQASFLSFAIITTEPNPEVLAMGHDRSPIYIKNEYIDSWLKEKDTSKAMDYLTDIQKIYYNYQYES